MFNFLRKLFPDTHPLRLFYHKVVGFIAAVLYRFPANKMVVIGVTGTNGKTTTINFITSVLNTAGFKVGMASSINYQIGEKRWVNASKQTTMSPFKLFKILREMADEGCKYCVLEVTSHALTQSRVFGINFDIGLITNVTGDHIDYHGSFNHYLNAKGKLFQKVSKGKRKFGVPKVLIMNADDKYYTYFNQFAADRKLTYGLKKSTIYADEIEKGPEGSRFVLHVPNNAVPVQIEMPGTFNIYNALAASSVAMALGVSLEVVARGLNAAATISGRFEHVNKGQNYTVIVDYAHTQDALGNLLEMYQRLSPGRVFAVFGATGGGRDKAKRPEMGKVAAKFSDYIILTDDDPYSEDELTILDQIAEGINREEGDRLWKIPDRREAIRLALTLAREGDCVVIAGKGCEEIMKVRGKTIPWSDKAIVEELLEREVVVALDEERWEKRENVQLMS